MHVRCDWLVGRPSQSSRSTWPKMVNGSARQACIVQVATAQDGGPWRMGSGGAGSLHAQGRAWENRTRQPPFRVARLEAGAGARDPREISRARAGASAGRVAASGWLGAGERALRKRRRDAHDAAGQRGKFGFVKTESTRIHQQEDHVRVRIDEVAIIWSFSFE